MRLAVMQTPETIRDDFDRLATLPDSGWNHNRHYHARLLSGVPRRCGEALDAGCGTGELTRLLAARCARVTGVDLSPRMVAEARNRSAGLANVDYAVADFMTAPLPTGGYDCVASVAVLHHLGLADALRRLGELLRPGGMLLVLDLRQSGPLVSDLGALAVSLALGARHNGRLREPRAVRDAWEAHCRTDRFPSMAEVREACARE